MGLLLEGHAFNGCFPPWQETRERDWLTVKRAICNMYVPLETRESQVFVLQLIKKALNIAGNLECTKIIERDKSHKSFKRCLS